MNRLRWPDSANYSPIIPVRFTRRRHRGNAEQTRFLLRACAEIADPGAGRAAICGAREDVHPEGEAALP